MHKIVLSHDIESLYKIYITKFRQIVNIYSFYSINIENSFYYNY